MKRPVIFIKYGAENVRLYIVGRKGRDYFKRVGLPILKEYTNIFNNLGFQHAEIITADLVERLCGPNRCVAVDLLYNEFKSVVQQKVVVKPLLPLAPSKVETPMAEPILFMSLRRKV